MMSNLRILGRLLLVVVGARDRGKQPASRGPRMTTSGRRRTSCAARECDGRACVIAAGAPIFDQMDQWVFGRLGGSAGARSKLDSSLLVRIEDLERVCGITEAQKNKLRLAGRGDIKRFFDKVEALKRKFQQGQNDPNTNIWQEIQPLQVELNTGLFGDDSLYAKTIRRTLSPEQAARFESLARERRAFAFGRRSSGSSPIWTRAWG